MRVSREAAEAAAFYRDLIQLDVAIRLVPRVVAAADAFAEGDRARIGGWWIRPDVQLCPENINWFSYQIYRDDLPEWLRAEDLASVICALEALAQFVLCLLLIEEVEPESRPACLGRMILRQQCDNQGVVGASAQGASMTQPLSSVLQATAKLCLEQGVSLHISHVPGERNSWADALSRGREVLPHFWVRLQQTLRHQVAWRQLLDDLVPTPKRLV